MPYIALKSFNVGQMEIARGVIPDGVLREGQLPSLIRFGFIAQHDEKKHGPIQKGVERPPESTEAPKEAKAKAAAKK